MNPLAASALVLLALTTSAIAATTIKDVFLPDNQFKRSARDSLINGRYAAARAEQPSRPLKPEESPEPGPGINVDKRCTRCDPLYPDYRFVKNVLCFVSTNLC